ncbi:hypothetical protein [Micromonospora sp. KLBMP9576]|uniref:hypothetical protein n=1 Tax=Micromonospora sp. KLBMP9576 TaxID=3424769 RepID=UPI003D8B8901
MTCYHQPTRIYSPSRRGCTDTWPRSLSTRTSNCCAASPYGTNSPGSAPTPRPGRCAPPPNSTRPVSSPKPNCFLSWLHQRDINPSHVTQATIDNWHVTHRVHQRHLIRGFLLWATEHHHLPLHLIAHRVSFQPGSSLTQQRRLALLRRYLSDDTAPAPARAAAVLMLLYAQPLSRVQHLTHDDLLDIDGEPHLRLGEPPSPLPPAVAQLLDRLISERGDDQWLFPGRLPGQPVAYNTLHRWLRQLDFPLVEAHASALRQLVLQAPAPVIADTLGFHQTTTTRQRAHAGATWNRYPASRHRSELTDA